MAIARAKGGCICQLPGRSPSAAKTILWCHAVDALDTNYGGKRHGLQRLSGQVLVSGKSSVTVCSLVSRTNDETSTGPHVSAIKRPSGWAFYKLRAALLLELLQNKCLSGFSQVSWYGSSEGLVSKIF